MNPTLLHSYTYPYPLLAGRNKALTSASPSSNFVKKRIDIETEMRKRTSTMGKTTACCSKVEVKRGPWTPEEDELLANYVRREGEGRWRTLPKRAGLLRCGKSCRLRWMNYLRPSVKRGRIAPDEEDLILRLHRLLGNRWSLIAGRLPGRTDNEIKNYWNTHLSKKLINQGIDPRTHKPLVTHPNPNPNPDLSTSSTTILSTDPNPNPFPNLNPNINFSAGLGLIESEQALAANHVSNPSPAPRTLVVENKVGNSADHYLQEYRVANNCNQTSWNHSDGTVMGLQSTHGNYGNQDNCIEYCNDDIFSSLFLTSLMNEEDVFKNQQQEHTNMMTVPSSSTQPVMSSIHMQVSNHGMAAWEASLQQASNMQPTFSNEWNGFNNQFA